MDNIRSLAILPCKLSTYNGVRTFDLMVNSLAKVMKQAGTFCLLDIYAKLGGHDPAEEGNLQRVLINILTV